MGRFTPVIIQWLCKSGVHFTCSRSIIYFPQGLRETLEAQCDSAAAAAAAAEADVLRAMAERDEVRDQSADSCVLSLLIRQVSQGGWVQPVECTI